MTIVETVLIFVGIPAWSYLVLTFLVFGPARARAPRYRPGRPWNYPAVWYLPCPERGDTDQAALEPGRARPALPANSAKPSGGPLLATAAGSKAARGGAHGSW